MPIPLGSGVCLPDEYKGKVSAGDQGAAIDYILGHMGTNVVAVDIFDTLYEHRDEYLYFRTDHHWTQLAAYYAETGGGQNIPVDVTSVKQVKKIPNGKPGMVIYHSYKTVIANPYADIVVDQLNAEKKETE